MIDTSQDNHPLGSNTKRTPLAIFFMWWNLLSAICCFAFGGYASLSTGPVATPERIAGYIIGACLFGFVSYQIKENGSLAGPLAWVVTGLMALEVALQGFVPLQIIYLGFYAYGAYRLTAERKSLRSSTPQVNVLPQAPPMVKEFENNSANAPAEVETNANLPSPQSLPTASTSEEQEIKSRDYSFYFIGASLALLALVVGWGVFQNLTRNRDSATAASATGDLFDRVASQPTKTLEPCAAGLPAGVSVEPFTPAEIALLTVAGAKQGEGTEHDHLFIRKFTNNSEKCLARIEFEIVLSSVTDQNFTVHVRQDIELSPGWGESDDGKWWIYMWTKNYPLNEEPKLVSWKISKAWGFTLSPSAPQTANQKTDAVSSPIVGQPTVPPASTSAPSRPNTSHARVTRCPDGVPSDASVHEIDTSGVVGSRARLLNDAIDGWTFFFDASNRSAKYCVASLEIEAQIQGDDGMIGTGSVGKMNLNPPLDIGRHGEVQGHVKFTDVSGSNPTLLKWRIAKAWGFDLNPNEGAESQQQP